MHEALLQQFISLVGEATGLQIRPQDRDLFVQKLQRRWQAAGQPTPEAYYHLLYENRKNTGYPEWRELLALLTTTESYFFRDQGQFTLLREVLLPNLIRSKQTLPSRSGDRPLKRSLRCWSAGCSTGEEAYSLAILLHETIANWEDWQIVIIGTDINQTTLTTAQRGIYSDWSFRHTESNLRQKYFRSHNGGWEIRPEIRRMVTFRYGNLVQDPFPNTHLGLYDFDLILCRNVFIYFDAEAIQRVLHKFYASLLPNGYLITGHTELYGQTLPPFRVCNFPQSILYQRSPDQDLPVHLPVPPTPLPPPLPVAPLSLAGAPPLPLSSPITVPLPAPLPCQPPISPQPASLTPVLAANPELAVPTQPALDSLTAGQTPELAAIVQLLEQGAYAQAIAAAKTLIQQQPQCLPAFCLMAEAYASLGAYAQAEAACKQALELNAWVLRPYYLLAQIAEATGDFEGAKVFLKRIIYLEPDAIHAYVELGNLYDREGNWARANKMWLSALEMLKKLAPDTPIEAAPSLTVTELQQYLEKKVKITP